MVAAASQNMFDALRWTCVASVIRHEVGRTSVRVQAESGSALAPHALEATPVSSGDESGSFNRDARRRISPGEECGEALISSAAGEAEANNIAVNRVEEEEHASPIDEVDTDGDDRPLIRSLVPQGARELRGTTPSRRI